jgi:Lon-like ATP-dependent protease
MDAKRLSQSIEQQYVNEKVERKKKYSIGTGGESKVGKVNGLAVMGDDSGIVLPVMGKVSESQNTGKIIATGKLQDIAEEAVDNVSAIIKDIGSDLTNKDIHVQFVQTYEGVQGDSASVTVATAVISAIKDIPIKQNVAMTGSLSIRGDVLPVGGVTHKVEAAAKQNIEKVLIPKANEDDVMVESEYEDQIEVIPVSHINEVLSIALVDDEKGKYEKLINKISSLANAPKVSDVANKNIDPS